MVRWRLWLVLAVLLMLPARNSSKSEDEEEEDSENKEEPIKIRTFTRSSVSRRGEEGEEDEDDDDDDEEEEDKSGAENSATISGRRAPALLVTPKSLGLVAAATRTTKKRPLECYVCAYKSETPLRACLDPTKFRVHTITCHSVDDKCFTSVISKGDSYEAVVRGCRSGCISSAETTCCEVNRCNNQAFAMPLVQPRVAPKEAESPSNSAKRLKYIPPLFFISILLLLQTVARVTIV